MLACDKFIFIHLHKSGGTFVNQLMLRCLPAAHRLGYHLPYQELPAALRTLPVLGTVRNPLGYYVSWYHFQLQLPTERRNALFDVCSEGASLGFSETIANLVALHDRPLLVDRLAAALPAQYQSFGLNLRRGDIGAVLGSGQGFYTFLYRRLYAGTPDPVLLRMEALRGALADYLDGAYPGPSQAWRAFLASAPSLNTSRHGDVLDYYSPALQAQVRQLDAAIFERHGY